MAEMGVVTEKHHHEVAAAQHELGIKFGPLVKLADSHADLQVRDPQGGAGLRQDRDASCRSRCSATTARACTCHQSIWKGATPVFAGNKYADLSDMALLLHRRHPQARQGAQRLHQPDHQLLQAAGAGLRGAGAARLLLAQPLGVLPHPAGDRARRPSASRSASPIRPPTPISPSPPC